MQVQRLVGAGSKTACICLRATCATYFQYSYSFRTASVVVVVVVVVVVMVVVLLLLVVVVVVEAVDNNHFSCATGSCGATVVTIYT